MPSLCNAPAKNFETHFISDEMLEDIPYNQVIKINTYLHVILNILQIFKWYAHSILYVRHFYAQFP